MSRQSHPHVLWPSDGFVGVTSEGRCTIATVMHEIVLLGLQASLTAPEELSKQINLIPGRGDCYRGSGAAEMAVRDYKRALEVEPGNWMVKTRLSMAHYLKVRSWFETRLVVIHTHRAVVFISHHPSDGKIENGLERRVLET